MQPTQRPDRCAELVALFAKAPIKKTFGMILSYDDASQAVFDLPHNDALERALGDTHGGIIATLLDNAGWFTVAAQYDFWIATVEMQMRLLEPAKREDLKATGKIIRLGRSLSVAEMAVLSGSGRLVATGSGTFSVTSLAAK